MRRPFEGNACTYRKVILGAITTCLLMVSCVLYGQETKTGEKVRLTIAVPMDAKSASLVFVVKNCGDKVVYTTPICTSYNRIVVVTPSGKELEHFVWVDIKPVPIKPSEEVSWTVDMVRIFESMKLTEPGLYRVYWKFGDQQSSDIWLLKGNR